MSDFFDDLERQLVHATADREPRLRRARARRRRRVIAAVAVLLLVAIGAGVGVLDNSSDTGRPATTVPVPKLPPVVTTPKAPISDFPVVVLNGTRQPGLAEEVARRLTAAGFTVQKVGNAPRRNRTKTVVSIVTPDSADTARAIRRTLGLPGGRTGSVTFPPPELRPYLGRRTDILVVVGAR